MRWIPLALVLGSSCGQPAADGALTAIFEGIVRNRASIEFPCPAEQLAIEDLEGEAFRATGCDDYATYECEYNDDDNSDTLYVCKRAAADGPEHIDAGM
jgi:hypothetical protein